MPALYKPKKVSDEERQFHIMFGKALRVARIAKNLSQEYVAEKLGITFQQLQKYENGTNSLSIYKLKIITDILGPSFYEVYSDIITNKPNLEKVFSSRNLHLLRKLSALKEKDARILTTAFLNMIRTYGKES